MRVITGTARGRKLKTLENYDIRPTTDKVKEAIFSTIQFDIEGCMFLDLFAGSGQMGIEALSRGARSAYFVDMSRQSCDIVRENLEVTGLKENAVITNIDSIHFLKTNKRVFDVAMLDPPYKQGLIMEVLPLLEKSMSINGKIICEHERELILPEKIGKMYLKKKYKYGKIEVSLYEMKEEN